MKNERIALSELIKSKHGFTMIEMLVVMVLFCVVMGSIYFVLQSGLLVWKRGEDDLLRYNSVRILCSMLNEDLLCIPSDAAPFMTEMLAPVSGAMELTMLTCGSDVANADSSLRRMAWVTYKFEPETNAIVRLRKPLVVALPKPRMLDQGIVDPQQSLLLRSLTGPEERVVVAQHIEEFTVATQPLSVPPEQQAKVQLLPAQVAIQMRFVPRDSGEMPQTFKRVFFLPQAADGGRQLIAAR